MPNLLKVFAAIIVGMMVTISPALGTDLAGYRWKNRLLLIFSPTRSNPNFATFNQDLMRRSLEVDDRDLIVFRILEEGPSQRGKKPLAPEDAENLRRRFGARPGVFTVILIGKDGGVKMVREDHAELQEIFDLIDSMPMRQREMREQGEIQ
jgi:hypothetical protein